MIASTDCSGRYTGRDTQTSDKDRLILVLEKELRKLRAENDGLKRNLQEIQQALWLNNDRMKTTVNE